MQIGMIGLGRMGMNMARRLLRGGPARLASTSEARVAGGHEVVVFNRSPEKVKEMVAEGAVGSASLEELVGKLTPPRCAWIMLPAGAVTEEHAAQLIDLLERDDILVEGGNSFYRDDIRRAERCAEKGIHALDAGVSGGIWGRENGYCTMVGGERAAFERIEPLLATLAPKEGYHYCGPAGSGHFVKMVHNGIEYAMMEAYGEGFELLRRSPYGDELDLGAIAHLWNQGSVVRSWLLELLADALRKDPGLAGLRGFVEDSGEGRWTVQQAVELGVSAPVIAGALFRRFASREPDAFSNKVLAALRNAFGGHAVKHD